MWNYATDLSNYLTERFANLLSELSANSADAIALVTAVATLFLAVATFKTATATRETVSEMREARRQSVRPRIMLAHPEQFQKLVWQPDNDNMPLSIDSFGVDDPSQSGTEGARIPKFQMINVGSGPAEEISLQWRYLGPSIETLINNSPLLKKYGAEHDGQMFHLTRHKVPHGTGMTSRETAKVICAPAEKTEITFCAPLSHTAPMAVEIPTSVLNCLRIFFVANAEKGPLSDCRIEVKVTYRAADPGDVLTPQIQRFGVRGYAQLREFDQDGMRVTHNQAGFIEGVFWFRPGTASTNAFDSVTSVMSMP